MRLVACCGMRIETIDLEFQGTAHAIAAFLVHGDSGPVLIETGPGSTLPVLLRELERRGLEAANVRHVLVSHIHLDHAGAAGWWAQQGATVYVHHVGAPHLIDPSKLLASAGRIYGEHMDRLWGKTLAAPADRVVAVEDGEVIRVEGLEIVALDTPGHAWHHHVYRIGEIGFSGDAMGIRIPGTDWLDIPAPPPEFNLDTWLATLKRLRGEGLTQVYRTHFGPADRVEDQLESFEELLRSTAEFVRSMMLEGAERDAMVERYNGWMRDRAARAGVDEETARAYELANPRFMSVDGMIRYWSKRL